ncbi:uncharacterized protein LOC105248144 isoform X3 [Camponotus floridanus]|uniref:uncharacterized protein LOC105248144 isoform X3 n=1 Tax=Camponotus floridanus TaxID=104421 RepID=UPI000DC6A50B|nr:uncharacterized protein LOC105248144 isoform X3 [Camponotus floridanus]
MPAALVVAVVVAVVVVVAVLAVVVVAVLAVLTVVVVVVVVVVVAAAVLIRWSSLKLPSSSAKSKLRFDPRARQILTDDDYETTAMLDSPSATLVSTPPDPVSSAFGLIVNLKTAELPVMTGSVYLAVYKRASARCVSTGILSPDYLSYHLPTKRERYETLGVEDCCHGYRAYTEVSADKRIRRLDDF